MQKVFLEPSYILYKKQYRNSSILLYALTQQYGLISLVAPAARRSKGLSLQLQEFNHLLLSWSGKGDLFTLTHAEESRDIEGIDTLLSGKKLLCGYYINELMWRFLQGRDSSCDDLFQIYQQTILALKQIQNSIEPILRRYELQLLRVLGYEPTLNVEIHANCPVIYNQQYRYLAKSGAVQASRKVVQDEGVLLSGSTLLALHELDFSDDLTIRESKLLLRYLIDYFLDGKKIYSREFIAAYRNNPPCTSAAL